MKKRTIMCIVVGAMIGGSISSCGNNDVSESSLTVETATTITQATEAATESETATTNGTEAETTIVNTENITNEPSINEDDEQLTNEATILLSQLNDIDCISSNSNFGKDFTQTIEEGDKTYVLVTDDRFQTVESIKNYVNQYIGGHLSADTAICMKVIIRSLLKEMEKCGYLAIHEDVVFSMQAIRLLVM